MPPKKLRDVLFRCESEEHALEKISAENKKLICLDLHLAWCGRCDNMEQNYRNLHVKYDEDFVRMEFFSCVEEFIPENVLQNLKAGPLTCRPRFVLFFEGNKMDEIDGADFTKLDASIGKNLPQLDD